MSLPKFTSVGRTDIQGRLLTPEEGCGYATITLDKRYHTGTAKNGAWPWITLLGQKFDFSVDFKCGKHFSSSIFHLM